VTAGGAPYATSLADAQGGLILSPGFGGIVIQTGIAPTGMPTLANIAAADVNLGSAPLLMLVDNSASVGLASFHSAEAKEDAQAPAENSSPRPAGLIVAGLPTNGQVLASSPASVSAVQVVTLPTFNTNPVGSPIAQIADRLFTAVGRKLDSAAELDWSSEVRSNLIGDTDMPPADASADSASVRRDPDAIDQVFADLAGESDDISALGDN
jgi:hypothetical protein